MHLPRIREGVVPRLCRMCSLLQRAKRCGPPAGKDTAPGLISSGNKEAELSGAAEEKEPEAHSSPCSIAQRVAALRVDTPILL
jgi:hypothetical protein